MYPALVHRAAQLIFGESLQTLTFGGKVLVSVYMDKYRPALETEHFFGLGAAANKAGVTSFTFCQCTEHLTVPLQAA